MKEDPRLDITPVQLMNDLTQKERLMRVLRDIHDLVDGAVDIDSLEKLQDIINDIQGVIEWDYSMEDLGK